MTTKIASWLPGFNGFYGSIYEDDSMESEEIHYILEDTWNGLLRDLPIDLWEFAEVDYEGYYQALSKAICEHIGDYLVEKIPPLISVTMEKLVSPREYNFTNDSINCVYEVEQPAFTGWLNKSLGEREHEWEAHLRASYTSRDGFWSHYPNTPEEWEELTSYYSDLDGHHLGAILNGIIWFMWDDVLDYLEELSIYYAVQESVYFSEYVTCKIPPLDEIPGDIQDIFYALVNDYHGAAKQARTYLERVPKANRKAWKDCEKFKKKTIDEMLELLQEVLI